VVGHPDDLQAAIDGMPDGTVPTVRRVGDYTGTVDDGLTDRQREALAAAWDAGFYEVPRNGGIEDVAAALDCAVSTASDLLRRAESRLVGDVLGSGSERVCTTETEEAVAVDTRRMLLRDATPRTRWPSSPSTSPPPAASLAPSTPGAGPGLGEQARRGSERYDTADLLVGERDGEVAGFGEWDDGEVVACYVHPDHARTGVGSALLERLHEELREAGYDRATLTSSLNAVGFYERYGYEAVDRRVLDPANVAFPVVEMEREF